MKRDKKIKRHSASESITAELRRANIPFKANDCIGGQISEADRIGIEADVRVAFDQVMRALVIDTDDPNAKGTAERMAKMYVREIFAGRYQTQPRMIDFPNGKQLDELYTVGPIAVRSACSHHLCPVEGKLWIGVIPSDRVIGISKFTRVARWILARPQIQEEAIVQIADFLEQLIRPRGLAVVIRAMHSCMTWRGVLEHETVMTTNVMRGIIKESPTARTEFFQSIAARGFSCLT